MRLDAGASSGRDEKGPTMPITTCRICQDAFECSSEDEAGMPLHACSPLDRVCVVCAVEDGDTWAVLSQAQRDGAMARFIRTMRASGPEA